MDNFIEKAIAVKRWYYEEAIALRIDLYGPDYDVETFDFCKDAKIELLSQLVATYFMYDGNIPDKFSIKLSSSYNTDWLLATLQKIFNDLATIYKVATVSHVHSLSIYNGYASAYAYDITLLK